MASSSSTIDSSAVVGPVNDTAAGDVVSVLVSSDPPYGVTWEADEAGMAAIIKSFDKLPSGKFGPIQKHGGIHYGDVLFGINDILLDSVSHADAIAMIHDRNILKKTFKFMNHREYYRRRRGMGAHHTGSTTAAENSKSSFLSSIRRYRVSQDEKKFVEYEIACQLRVPGTRVQKDIVHKWSVWKRYSEFEKLNSALRISLGWQLEGIEFPSPYTFSLNKLSPDFIEQRRDELNRYWQRIVIIDRVTDFSKHHCSQEIKVFLGIDDVLKGAKLSAPELVENAPDEEKETREEDKRLSANRKAINRTSSIRRRSLNASLSSSTQAPNADSGSPALNLGTASGQNPSYQNASSGNKSNNQSSVSSNGTNADASQPASAVTPRGANPPPPPPPKRNNMDTESEKPSGAGSTSSMVASLPKPGQARLNLLSQISALKKD